MIARFPLRRSWAAVCRAAGFAAAGLAMLSSPTASAGTMLQPASASTTIPTFGGDFSPMNVVNQSGMWSPYESGVTDFATYTSSEPMHSRGGGWRSEYFYLTGNFDFDLGGSHLIAGLALWSGIGDASAIAVFRLLASDNAAFTNAVVLGTFTNTDPGGSRPNFYPPSVFSFQDTVASYVRMEILSNQGDIFNTSMLEVAFDASPVAAVPEPATVVSLALGLTVFAIPMVMCRRQTARPGGTGYPQQV